MPSLAQREMPPAKSCERLLPRAVAASSAANRTFLGSCTMVRTVVELLPRGLVTLRTLGTGAVGIAAAGFAGPFKRLLLIYSSGSFLVTLT